MSSIEDLVLKHRDIYMNYRDLSDKCFIDVSQIGKLVISNIIFLCK